MLFQKHPGKMKNQRIFVNNETGYCSSICVVVLGVGFKAFTINFDQATKKFCFKVIWNMKSNVYVDEDSQQKDPSIGEKLENLIERMTKELSGPAMSFYEREFDFFDRVTQISGQIRYKACLVYCI